MLMGLGYALCLIGGLLIVAPMFVDTGLMNPGWFMLIGFLTIIFGIISFACA